jgi:hypothetical protein
MIPNHKAYYIVLSEKFLEYANVAEGDINQETTCFLWVGGQWEGNHERDF